MSKIDVLLVLGSKELYTKVSTKCLEYSRKHYSYLDMRCIVLYTIAKCALSAFKCYLICNTSQFQNWAIMHEIMVGSGSKFAKSGLYRTIHCGIDWNYHLGMPYWFGWMLVFLPKYIRLWCSIGYKWGSVVKAERTCNTLHIQVTPEIWFPKYSKFFVLKFYAYLLESLVVNAL